MLSVSLSSQLCPLGQKVQELSWPCAEENTPTPFPVHQSLIEEVVQASYWELWAELLMFLVHPQHFPSPLSPRVALTEMNAENSPEVFHFPIRELSQSFNQVL